jgi:small conductance mechanosensitive channel
MTTTTADASTPLTISAVFDEVRRFVTEVASLDPEQAALRGGLTILVVVGALVLVWGLRTLLQALSERLTDRAALASDGKKIEIGRWSMRVVRIAIGLTALGVILNVWGLSFDDLRDGPLGGIIAAVLRIAVVLAVAFAAMELVQLGIHRMFTGIARRARNARRAAQVRTLAPLLSGVATTTILVLAAMMTLSEIGVEIGPLIAGAGIVGLAVGFGAQTLVKDFLTGLFLVIEDTVSIGDVVRIGDAAGAVEGMSLRTIKLRDLDGTLHVIPYGEAQIVHNMTKGFSFCVFDLSIAYSADIATALKVLEQTGEGMVRDEAFGTHILAPMEVFGVDKLADSGVIIKARIRTQPAQQWAVGREFLKRIKLAFDEAGIEIPFPHLKITADEPIQIVSTSGPAGPAS